MTEGGTAPRATVEPQLEDPDAFYEALIQAHEGLSTEASFELNVRLLMLLANQVGDHGVLAECVRLARESASD